MTRPTAAAHPRHRTVALALGLAVTLFVAARLIGLLIVPVAVAGAALAVVRRRRQRWVMRRNRVEAWAVHAPSGSSSPTAFEWVIAGDLAAASGADTSSLRLARAIVSECVDPWQRELAAERLGRAEEILATRGPARGANRDAWTAAAWAAMSSLVVLSSVLPLPSPLAAAVCALALAVAVLTWSELCEAWGERPYRLARAALVPSHWTPFAVSEPALVKLLVELAGCDPAVLDGAAAHIDELRWSPVTARALARVDAARRVLTLVPAAGPGPAVAPARRTT
ncbi:MAG: hypothetical protein M3133_11135 [Actinomycetota bacterium]|nr:hypothetical protein [Actinomycetota bacterium]